MVTDKDVTEFQKILEQISKDFERFTHTSLTKDFIKDYEISYHHAQAIMELKLLEVRKKFDNARMKEYRWAAGNPTKVMSRQVLELTEELKSEGRRKPLEFTSKDKIRMVERALMLMEYPDNKDLSITVQLVEYISDHEWNSRFSDILDIIDEYIANKHQERETLKEE